MSETLCKEWSVPANKFVGLCSQQYYPVAGNNECPICVSPAPPKNACQTNFSLGNCAGVRFPFRVTFEVPTLVEPFENGEYTQTVTRVSNGVTTVGKVFWKSVPAADLSGMTNLTVPGYNPSLGNNQVNPCRWENKYLGRRWFLLDLVNFNRQALGLPISESGNCPPPAPACLYHVAQCSVIDTDRSSGVSPFSSQCNTLTTTQNCVSANYPSKPRKTCRSNLFEAMWSLYLTGPGINGEMSAILNLTRRFCVYAEIDSNGWNLLDGTTRCGQERSYQFRSEFYNSKAPTNITSFDFPFHGFTSAVEQAGVPPGSKKYGSFIGMQIGQWMISGICVPKTFSVWRMNKTYDVHEEYPELTISNLPSEISVKINAGV